MANVQISQELFLELIKYHCLDMRETDRSRRITAELESKLDRMANRELYGAYANKSATAEDRKAAITKYLDKKGVPDSFRWSK